MTTPPAATYSTPFFSNVGVWLGRGFRLAGAALLLMARMVLGVVEFVIEHLWSFAAFVAFPLAAGGSVALFAAATSIPVQPYLLGASVSGGLFAVVTFFWVLSKVINP